MYITIFHGTKKKDSENWIILCWIILDNKKIYQLWNKGEYTELLFRSMQDLEFQYFRNAMLWVFVIPLSLACCIAIVIDILLPIYIYNIVIYIII